MKTIIVLTKKNLTCAIVLDAKASEYDKNQVRRAIRELLTLGWSIKL